MNYINYDIVLESALNDMVSESRRRPVGQGSRTAKTVHRLKMAEKQADEDKVKMEDVELNNVFDACYLGSVHLASRWGLQSSS